MSLSPALYGGALFAPPAAPQGYSRSFATNYDARESEGPSPLEQAIGARLFSRLCERALFVPVEGSDVRRWL